MNNFANDLHIEGRIANDLLKAGDELISRHPAAMIAAARQHRSQELARLLTMAGKAIAKFFKSIPWTTDMEALHYKKAVRELDALSDRMLADIGVERRMIPEVVRANMAAKKQAADVVKADIEQSVGSKTAPSAANCNNIKKHHAA
jgi:uncharacterized protein YjiS (DUF1127 family)